MAQQPRSVGMTIRDPRDIAIIGIGCRFLGATGPQAFWRLMCDGVDAIREAYRNSGVPPGRVQYVEAHGTGTSVGDPIEAQALGAVLAEGRSRLDELSDDEVDALLRAHAIEGPAPTSEQ
jgi:acyl transferase domain-containing protein